MLNFFAISVLLLFTTGASAMSLPPSYTATGEIINNTNYHAKRVGEFHAATSSCTLQLTRSCWGNGSEEAMHGVTPGHEPTDNLSNMAGENSSLFRVGSLYPDPVVANVVYQFLDENDTVVEQCAFYLTVDGMRIEDYSPAVKCMNNQFSIDISVTQPYDLSVSREIVTRYNVSSRSAE